MATHKVPQDVEADDKLIGFLSLKQFIFVVLGLGFGYLTFIFFTKVHPIAALLWVPPTGFFLILGLYQRKDQPAEVFLASAIKFYLQPRKRKWDPEGYIERVQITAPPVVDKQYSRNISHEEAVSKLRSLSQIMDTAGWASKGVDWQNPDTAAILNDSDRPVAIQAQAASMPMLPVPADPLDDNSLIGQQLQQKVDNTSDQLRQRAAAVIEQARQRQEAQPSTPTTPPPTTTSPLQDPISPAINNPSDEPLPTPRFDHYPDMHQRIIAPQAAPAPTLSQPLEVTPEAPVLIPPPSSNTTVQITSQAAAQSVELDDDGAVEISLH